MPSTGASNTASPSATLTSETLYLFLGGSEARAADLARVLRAIGVHKAETRVVILVQYQSDVVLFTT